MAIDRKQFLATILALLVRPRISIAQERRGPKVLIVVAHPDDEYASAATTYRIARELDGTVDQVVITNGEGGYRYSALAESFYGVALSDERDGRARLPAIRKQEVLRAGEILGIRKHYFLDQKDSGFTNDPARARTDNWDLRLIDATLTDLLKREHYDFVFTLLPTEETHAHHRAATLAAVQAVGHLEEDQRPAVLGAEPGRKRDGAPKLEGLGPAFQFDRTSSFGYHNALSYEMVVNWMIAEHKSQGLFQTDYGRHDVERFWLLTAKSLPAAKRTEELADRLRYAAARQLP
ncbi:MAG: LmbE family protein [Bryobacterales bacterium]|nr:LmbE family protein [Bryobacterales bacterium]